MNPSWCSLLGDPQGWVEIAMRQLLSLLNAYAALLLVILSVGVVLRAVRIVQEKITGLRRESVPPIFAGKEPFAMHAQRLLRFFL
jgi:hypothetical protein